MKKLTDIERARLLKEGLALVDRMCELLLECRARHESAVKGRQKAA